MGNGGDGRAVKGWGVLIGCVRARATASSSRPRPPPSRYSRMTCCLCCHLVQHPDDDEAVLVGRRQLAVVGVPRDAHHRAVVALERLVHREVRRRRRHVLRLGHVAHRRLELEHLPRASRRTTRRRRAEPNTPTENDGRARRNNNATGRDRAAGERATAREPARATARYHTRKGEEEVDDDEERCFPERHRHNGERHRRQDSMTKHALRAVRRRTTTTAVRRARARRQNRLRPREATLFLADMSDPQPMSRRGHARSTARARPSHARRERGAIQLALVSRACTVAWRSWRGVVRGGSLTLSRGSLPRTTRATSTPHH